MKQCALTLILPVSKKANADLLEQTLGEMGQQLNKNPKVDFRKSSLTHFARFVMLEKGYSGAPVTRLLFTSNYDGSPEAYAQDLIDSGIAPNLDEIFSKCDDYTPGTLLELTKATEFLKKRNLWACGFFIALIGAIKEIITKSADSRRQLDLLLDKGQISDQDKTIISQLYDECKTQRLNYPSTKEPKPSKGAVGRFLLGVFAAVMEWTVGVRYGQNNPQITVETSNHLYDMEDLVTQNQMTVIVPIKKSFLPRFLLRSIFFLVRIQVQFSKGSLSDLTTIHFARWVIIDNGDNLLFESNFDGSWENYIDDFVDHASVGMNLIWANCIGFPRGGSKDIESFKKYIRDNQTPAQLFYSAYKDSTVRNILTDLSLSGQVSRLTRENGKQNFTMGYYGA